MPRSPRVRLAIAILSAVLIFAFLRFSLDWGVVVSILVTLLVLAALEGVDRYSFSAVDKRKKRKRP